MPVPFRPLRVLTAAALAAALFVAAPAGAAKPKRPTPAQRTPASAQAAPARTETVGVSPLPKTCEASVVFDGYAPLADARFGRSRADNVRSLLAGGGLPASVFPLSALRQALAEPCRVAHLVRISRLTKEERRLVEDFVARGGRLVVYESFSPELAAIFGLVPPREERVGPSAAGDAWTGLALTPPLPLHAPAFLPNRTPRVPVVRVAAPTTKAVASWRSERGERGPPALFRAPCGYWLARTLYDDAPAADRSRLLLSLSCTLSPPLWRVSARALDESLWAPAGGARSCAGAERRLAAAAGPVREEIVHGLFRDVRALVKGKDELFGRGLYGASHTNLWEIGRRVRLAYAAAHPLPAPAPGRVLAVWESTGYGPQSAGGWDAAARALASAGVTDLYLWAGSLGGAVANLPGVPPTDARRLRGNPFPDAIAACRRYGVRVHAWLGTLQFRQPDDARRAAFVRAGRLLHNADGTPADWLDPAVKANADDLSRAVLALAASGVDGVSLDFLRYPDAKTREKRDAAKVTALLARLRADLRAAAPRCELSVSVYGGYPACANNVGQDWMLWLDRGLADRAMPMNYVSDLAGLRGLMAKQTRHRDRLLCGIGASARESVLDVPALVDQLREAYAQGYRGAAVYAFDDRFLEEFVPALLLAQ